MRLFTTIAINHTFAVVRLKNQENCIYINLASYGSGNDTAVFVLPAKILMGSGRLVSFLLLIFYNMVKQLNDILSLGSITAQAGLSVPRLPALEVYYHRQGLMELIVRER